MKITQLLVPEAMITGLSGTRQEAVLQLVQSLAKARGLDIDAALGAIAARERLGPSMFPAGPYHVAVPHAFFEAAKQLSMAVGICREGISWGAGDRKVNVVLVLLGPPQTQSLYLRVLSRIASLCQAEGLLDAWLRCDGPRELIESTGRAEANLGDIPGAEGMPTFCVVGAGNGGMAMAGHLALTGCRVALLNRGPTESCPSKSGEESTLPARWRVSPRSIWSRRMRPQPCGAWTS